MARRFDTRTNLFSPDGRLYQVEYASEAISHAGACIGIITNDGILLVAERLNPDKLLDEESYSDKIYRLNDDMACAVSGVTSDANVLVNEMRIIGQRHLVQYNEPIPCEHLVSSLCDIKQAYTQVGGKRPFGVSIIYMGWDRHHGYQLYQSDPSGNFSGWKATCIGRHSSAAISSLQQDYIEGEMTFYDAKNLAFDVLLKIMDASHLTPERVEMATLTHADDETDIHIFASDDVKELVDDYEIKKAIAEALKQQQEEEDS